MKRLLIGLTLCLAFGSAIAARAQNLGVWPATMITGSGAPALTCSATSYNGTLYGDTGSTNVYLCSNGTGGYAWRLLGGSSGGICGSAGQFQYNNSGVCGGTAGFTYVGVGQTAATSTDAMTGSSTVGYQSSNVNALNVPSEVAAQQGGTYSISALIGAVHTPSTSTIHQTNGVMGIIDDYSTSTNAVAGYFQAVAMANSVDVWGLNPLVASASGISGDLLTGVEVDVNIANAGDTARGINVTGAWGATPSVPPPAFEAQEPAGGHGGWGVSFLSDTEAAAIGVQLKPIHFTANSPSQEISLEDYDSSGTLRGGGIYQDATGAIVMASYSGVTKAAALRITTSPPSVLSCATVDTAGNVGNTGAPCPTSGTGSTVTVNGGAGLTIVNLNSSTPSPDSANVALPIKVDGSGNTIVEAPQASASVLGLMECGTGLTCVGGVASVGSVGSNPIWMTDDFLNYLAAYSGVGGLGGVFNWYANMSSATIVSGSASAGANGVWGITTTTTTNAWGTLLANGPTGNFNLFVGTGAALTIAAKVEETTTAAGKYYYGLASVNNAPNPSNFVGFWCDPIGNSNDHWWMQVVSSGTVTSNTDTGIAANAWHTLKLVIAGTGATFYIDSSSVGTATAVAGTYGMGVMAWNGTSTAASINIDWAGIVSTATP